MNDELIGRVSRPSRYIGNEINAVRKDHGLVDVKVVLAFPDTYEIGMSHLGLKILYEILNTREDTAAERAFAPWKDMEELLRAEGKPLCSMESNLPLRGFDIIGFTLQYEMSYTNILNMLDLSGIPLLASERGGSFPLIIGGGPCAFNPEPLADFFDLFVIGDGEEVINEIVDLIKEYRAEEKQALLARLSELEGVYVPSLFEVSYAADGKIEEVRRITPGPDRIRKRLVLDLNKAPYPCSPVLPYMQVVHDRVALEISRGCTRGCRFCQAGMIYRPLREREVDTLLGTLKESIQNSGHEEVALTSLSSGDYTALSPLVHEVVRFAEERHVSLSLPSLRPGTLSAEIIEGIRKIRKTGFTIAPEAGTQRLRDVINKGVSEEDLIDTVRKVFTAGWEVLKLYFMIGLPTETEEDLQGIIDLSHKALKVAREANPRLRKINVSISPFVPKSHTPFQWFSQNRPEEIAEKYRFLKRGLRNRKITMKWHEPEISMLEGVFSRGDRRLSRVLYEAWRLGCRFDGWTEEFDHSKWMEALRQGGADPEFYLHRERKFSENLPWDHIDSGIDKEFLSNEYKRSLEGEITPDCRDEICSNCGACDGSADLVLAHSTEGGHNRSRAGRQISPAVKRFRIRYAREGILRFLSHLEMVSVFVRSFSRAGIPVEYSKGFHPHPKVAMGPALPVGVSGTSEYFDVNIAGSLFEETMAERLNRVLPDGIRITGVNWISAKAPAISSMIRFAEYLLRIPLFCFQGEPTQKIDEFMLEEEIFVTRNRKGRLKSLDIRPFVEEMGILSQEEDIVVLRLMIQMGDKGSARLNEVLNKLLGHPDENLPEIHISRIGLYTDKERTAPFLEKVGKTVQTV